MFAGAGAATALACPAGPGAKPASEVTELQLPERAADPRVVYAVGEYEIHMKARDLLALMKGDGPVPFTDEAFAAILHARLPLRTDLSVREILTALAPEKPEPGEKTLRAADYARFWRQSDERLRYKLAELLESGHAAVVEKSSGAALETVMRNKYADGCYSGRKFLTSDGTLILAVVDSMS
jgi:hypothetical protein